MIGWDEVAVFALVGMLLMSVGTVIGWFVSLLWAELHARGPRGILGLAAGLVVAIGVVGFLHYA